MKKLIILTGTCLASLVLTACGNTNSNQAKTNSSLKNENSSLKAEHKQITPVEDKYSNAEYAMAAYLKLQGTDASTLANNKNMTWQQQGNRYVIGFGGHTTSMTVNREDVKVVYDDIKGDHMGSGNAYKVYSKSELDNSVKNQKHDIDKLLSSQQMTRPSESSTVSSNASSDNACYDLPLSGPRNTDGAKQAQIMSIAGDPQYRNTSDGSVNEQGRALMSSIRNTMRN